MQPYLSYHTDQLPFISVLVLPLKHCMVRALRLHLLKPTILLVLFSNLNLLDSPL